MAYSVRTRFFYGAALLLILGTLSCRTLLPDPTGGRLEQNHAKKTTREPYRKLSKRYKPWNKVLKDTRKQEGLLNLYLTPGRKLYLELDSTALQTTYGLVMHISRGIGGLNVFKGLELTGTRLIRFQKVGDKVLMIQENPRFRAPDTTALGQSLKENVGHSIVEAFDIVSVHPRTGHLLIDLTPWLISDVARISRRLRYYLGNHGVRLDRDRSYVDRVLAFPKNLELDVLLTFEADVPGNVDLPELSDPRSIPIGVHTSFFALPETPMQPRYADERLGHFLTVYEDFSNDRTPDPYRRLVERWRLEKKDPSAPLSEPVKPIVYYLDRSIPEKYRDAVRKGILAWNKAFEAAGFKHAIVVKDPPENDTTWRPEDIRYSTVIWTAAHDMGYAIGPSQVDPRTGEILNADILIDWSFVRGWVSDYREMAGPDKMVEENERILRFMERMQPEEADQLCLYARGMAHEMMMEDLVLREMGRVAPGEPIPEEYIEQAIIDLVMHEVGHTLGLRHNFRSSAATPFEKLQDTTWTRTHGVSASVMDYNPVNISVDPEHQGDYWNTTVGPYDIWAIRYAYTPFYSDSLQPLSPEEERPHLNDIASEIRDSLHLYGTDEDAYLGAYAIDPLTNTWDLSRSPLRYAIARTRLVQRLVPHLEDRLVAPDQSYYPLRRGVIHLLYERYSSSRSLVKYIGGIYFQRTHRADSLPPLRPVPRDTQRMVLNYLLKEVFEKPLIQADSALLNKLAPTRWSHWGMGGARPPLNFPLNRYMVQVQKPLLLDLFAPERLHRLVEFPAYTHKSAFTLPDLFEMTYRSFFKEFQKPSSTIPAFRRELQRLYVHVLTRLLLGIPPRPSEVGVPEDARSLARMTLKKMLEDLKRARVRTRDSLVRAHIEELQATIQKALDASWVEAFPLTH